MSKPRAAAAAEWLPAIHATPERLELEITETVLISNLEAVVEALTALHALGVHMVLDDFGAGYSSLSYLNDFEFDKVKVDRRFVRDIEVGKNSKGASIIRAVNAIAKDLQIEVVVEGVETIEQLAGLRALGICFAQGYLFSRPVFAPDIELWLLRELAAAQRNDAQGDVRRVCCTNI